MSDDIIVGPIRRITGTDSIDAPNLPLGHVVLGWGDQGWALQTAEGERLATGDWGDFTTITRPTPLDPERLVERLERVIRDFDQPPSIQSMKNINAQEAARDAITEIARLTEAEEEWVIERGVGQQQLDELAASLAERDKHIAVLREALAFCHVEMVAVFANPDLLKNSVSTMDRFAEGLGLACAALETPSAKP